MTNRELIHLSAMEAETEVVQPEETPQGDKHFTQDELDNIVKREKAKAKQTATSTLVTELGFSNTDELKNVVSAFKEHQEKQKSAEQRLAELENERKSLGEKAGKYEETINALLDAEIAQVPEDKRSLIPDEITDPVARLNWISRNRQFLTGRQSVNVGTNASPSAPVPTAPVSYEDFKKMKPGQLAEFHKQYPEVGSQYSERLRRGE